MTLSINLPADVEARLRQRASEVGQTPDSYAARVLADVVAMPTIDEILAPVRAEFAQTGMSEQELMDFGRDLLRKVREEKAAAG